MKKNVKLSKAAVSFLFLTFIALVRIFLLFVLKTDWFFLKEFAPPVVNNHYALSVVTTIIVVAAAAITHAWYPENTFIKTMKYLFWALLIGILTLSYPYPTT